MIAVLVISLLALLFFSVPIFVSLCLSTLLVFLMYFGRVGGLPMIYAFTAGNGTSVSQFPQEPVTVG